MVKFAARREYDSDISQLIAKDRLWQRRREEPREHELVEHRVIGINDMFTLK